MKEDLFRIPQACLDFLQPCMHFIICDVTHAEIILFDKSIAARKVVRRELTKYFGQVRRRRIKGRVISAGAPRQISWRVSL
jgi:hypothetical protein